MTILVVQDNEDHRLLLQLLLEEAGLGEVIACAGADEAMRVLQQDGADRVDAVVLDLELSGTSGIGLCRRIKADPRLRDVPVLMSATHGEAAYLEDAFAAGALDYVRKPFDRAELAVRLRSALALKHEMDARKAREAQLREVRERLQTSLDAIHGDLEAAGALQRSLLPDPAAAPAGVRFAGRLLPSEQLGGDMFNVARLRDGRVAAYMLDVSGHGVQAALTAVAMQRLLSAEAGGLSHAGDGSVRAPDEVIALLNRQLCRDERSGQYLTLSYLVLDCARREALVVQAGHPPLVLVDASGARLFEPGDPPVGMLEGLTYHTRRLVIPPGARLLLYSDGLIEAERAPGEHLGVAGLLECCRGSATLPLEAMADRILAAARAFRGERAFDDDLSLLILEVA